LGSRRRGISKTELEENQNSIRANEINSETAEFKFKMKYLTYRNYLFLEIPIDVNQNKFL
jgi:hypothetical protein